jgi:hypothetical protein
LEAAEGRIQVLVEKGNGGMRLVDLEVEDSVDEGEDEE